VNIKKTTHLENTFMLMSTNMTASDGRVMFLWAVEKSGFQKRNEPFPWDSSKVFK